MAKYLVSEADVIIHVAPQSQPEIIPVPFTEGVIKDTEADKTTATASAPEASKTTETTKSPEVEILTKEKSAEATANDAVEKAKSEKAKVVAKQKEAPKAAEPNKEFSSKPKTGLDAWNFLIKVL
jgi:hypothetical protein